VPHRGPPTHVPGDLDLAEDEVDHAVEQVVLVRDVPVQRHRRRPERLCELPHAESVDALVVGQPQCRVQDRLPAEAGLAGDLPVVGHSSLSSIAG
jgi:hypothetical protein